MFAGREYVLEKAIRIVVWYGGGGGQFRCRLLRLGNECDLPLEGKRVVTRIIADLAVIAEGLVPREIELGDSVDHLR